MSYLNPAEDWERLKDADPWLAAVISMAPRSLFVPPPGVDPFTAYSRVFMACLSLLLHLGLIGLGVA